VNYDEFELEVQNLLDDDRLDEADRLLEQVHPNHADQCRKLLDSYRVLFASLDELKSLQHPVEKSQPVASGSAVAVTGHSWPSLGVAIAACLAWMMVTPWISSPEAPSISQIPSNNPVLADTVLIDPVPTTIVSIVEEDASTLPQERTSFSPSMLASSFAQQTEGALQSFNQLASSMNPVNQSVGSAELEIYREAVPFIEKIARELVPGSKSLGEAISIIHQADQQSADPAEEVLPLAESSDMVVG